MFGVIEEESFGVNVDEWFSRFTKQQIGHFWRQNLGEFTFLVRDGPQSENIKVAVKQYPT